MDTAYNAVNGFMNVFSPLHISVTKLPDLPGNVLGGGIAHRSCRFRKGTSSGSPRFCEEYGAEQYLAGEVFLKSSTEFNNQIADHEMIHALGFGHACFPSANSKCSGGYLPPELPTEVPNCGGRFCSATEYDAAHFQLYQAVHHLVIEHDGNFGLIEALEGERVFELDVGPYRAAFLRG